MQSYPARIGIEPFAGPIQATVTVPGSKSITNRALILAALNADTTSCRISGVLRSEDTEVMIASLRQLGFIIREEWESKPPAVFVEKLDRQGSSLIPAREADLFVANSGTSMRFLTALVSLGVGTYRLDGIARMRERPIGDLLDSMKAAGIDVRSELNNGCPPVIVVGKGLGSWKSGIVPIRAAVSSQFLSALLMALPRGNPAAEVVIEGASVSEPYIEMTLKMCAQFGYRIERQGNHFRFIESTNLPQVYHVEPDASAASYFLAIPAIMGGSLTLLGLNKQSLQGDVLFVDALEQMGCRVEWQQDAITVHGGPINGISIDMNAISDTAMTLAVVACFAQGPTTIRNVAHIRHKETDRIGAIATELRKVGVQVDEYNDGLRIVPRMMNGASLDTYNDHRMAMSLALLGLRVPGIIINDPGCVVKTYPGFWQDLEEVKRKTPR
jgi:3-phosphoshikimate 1-carboxyvinyltransferase